MSNLIARFIKNESGATAIEYGLIAGIMATILIAVFATFKTDLTTAFGKIGTAMKGA
ncbi:MAG: Flp family type IVb pilin [Rhizobiaceae bacterium]|nr:Flp family type IVb pilin [Rhizobiaceae bacterium]